MRVLVACEFSGVVRRAFRALGHDAWSCDLLPAEDECDFHYRCDVFEAMNCFFNIDLLIAHPPCIHLAVSGARWFKDKLKEQAAALNFVERLMAAPIPRICIENPISIISSRIRKPDQIIQPYMFGHPEFKATCLWLKDLPKLTRTHALIPPKKEDANWKGWNKVHREPPGPDRWKARSRTYTGIADAMAAQWGALPTDAPRASQSGVSAKGSDQ
jgi:hypothetical protein